MATKVTTGLITDNAITDAKIANVAITGVTASGGDSSTALATTAFVAGEINSLIDAAPGALNTLNELAAAMGDDANFSTTVTNSIAGKLPLAGGTMTGHILLNNAVELRSKDTSSNIKTITRINSSNELEYGWSGSGPVKFMGGGAYTERVRIHTNGNVGIGTTSPGDTLHIVTDSSTTNDTVDVARIEATSSGTPAVGFGPTIDFRGERGSAAADSMGRIGYVADTMTASRIDGAFIVETAVDGTYSEHLRVTSTGKVGIGTTSPSAKLTITDENAGQPMLQVRNYATSATGSFGNAHSVELRSATSTTTHGVLIHHHEDNISRRSLEVADANGVFATFVQGKVGIGETAPFTRLHVEDTSWSSGAPYGAVASITGNNVNDDNWGHLIVTDSSTANGNGGSIRFGTGTADASNLNPFAGIQGVAEGTSYGGLGFYTRPSGGTATQRFHIDSNGKLEASYGFSAGSPFPYYYTKRSAMITAGSSQSRRARIGRIYFCPAHWSANGINLIARVQQQYYASGNRTYHLQANYTDNKVYAMMLEPHSRHSGDSRFYLGAVTDAGYDYAGGDVYYQDMYIEAATYRRCHVDFTSLGNNSGMAIHASDITSGWGGVVVYDSVQDQTDFSGSSLTDEIVNKHGDFFIATSNKVNDTLNQGEYFGFNQIQAGSSLNYNTGTYKYKCPADGVYEFGANVYRNSSSGGNICFRKTDSAGNNADDFGRQPNSIASGDFVFTLNQMKLCSKGDLVGVYNYGGSFSNFYGASDDTFSSYFGKLIRMT